MPTGKTPFAERRYNKTYPVRKTPPPNNRQTRFCQWCAAPIPKVQYGRRKFCSLVCLRTNDRDRTLRTEYNITLEDYLEMWRKQNGRCAVCQRKSSITLAVEHSHITGTVRGLACMACNRDVIHPIDGDLAKIDRTIGFFQRMRDDLALRTPLVEGDPENDPRMHVSGLPRGDLPF